MGCELDTPAKETATGLLDLNIPILIRTKMWFSRVQEQKARKIELQKRERPGKVRPDTTPQRYRMQKHVMVAFAVCDCCSDHSQESLGPCKELSKPLDLNRR
ncbi:hypothetical protein STEG23_036174 [Scotinomys teguina]